MSEGVVGIELILVLAPMGANVLVGRTLVVGIVIVVAAGAVVVVGLSFRTLALGLLVGRGVRC